ncbi:MAG TPA: aminodeoxychorismate synthase component I [Acidobacteriaceae bacterium]|jgi:para-aminobenzoate synthetase/4-amino-4-deoxychorismate lyase
MSTDPQTGRWYPLPRALRSLVVDSPDSVLLETNRPGGHNRSSYLFRDPRETFAIHSREDLLRAFARVEEATQAGHFVAGFFSYECAGLFDPHLLTSEVAPGQPYAWLGVYEDPIIFDHCADHYTGSAGDGQALHDIAGEPAVTAVQCSAELAISRAAYRQKIQAIHELIAGGDTYQVNLTDVVEGATSASPLELFEHLSLQQPVAYSALLNLPFANILSFSPELFFRRDGSGITVKPMKGTACRGADMQEDAAASLALRNDPKNHSEHVMIVDLLRNDLGKVCVPGSVRVPELCAVEPYRTLLQMTSTIHGRLRADASHLDVFGSLFPSGSITGAPKRRTMEIIHALEAKPRGSYTGAIGFFGPRQQAAFSVAIRTVVMTGSALRMGVGGGIVADSSADDEYDECLLKAKFLSANAPDFKLIETMRWHQGVALLELHEERIAASAVYFDFPFSARAFHAALETSAAGFEPAIDYRVRITLDRFGRFDVTSMVLDENSWKGRLKLCTEHTNSPDIFLHHKTTNRALYLREFAEAQRQGFGEVLFQNEEGALTEAANHNLCVLLEGKWLTPPVRTGALPGVYRSYLLRKGEATEASLTLQSLHNAQAISLCNAVRGLRPVHEIVSASGELIWKAPG